jgi:hypothetical protein
MLRDGFWGKVHYNALFGPRKNGKYKAFQRRDAKFAEEERRKPRDPGTVHADGVIASIEPVLR